MPSLTSGSSGQQPRATPVYGTTVTTNASQGLWHTITVTNTTPFTIAAPISNPGANFSQVMVIEVFNSSGGAMGTITWNNVFVFATGAWTNPANTKKRFIRFEWNGSKWISISMATTDY